MRIPDDPFIIELLPEFVDTWINDIDSQLMGIIEAKKADDLYRFGHTLKGSCFQFGLDEVAALGIELMGYAREQNWDSAIELEGKLKNAFKEVKTYVEDNLPK